MKSKKQKSRSRWWLLVWCVFLAIALASGLGIQNAQAASPAKILHPFKQALPACSQCISDISPADGSTVQTDANGNVTITVTAQINNNYTKFTVAIDQVNVDPTQVQVSGGATSPTATVVMALTNGKHHVFAQVYDATGPVASAGWNFTVMVTVTPTPLVTPTTPPTAKAGGSNGGSDSTAAKSGIVLNTVSLALFSVAILGLLVIAFILGMWFGGRKLSAQ